MAIVILNIALILIALLIGYWWANQGLFSAILHLLCVIAAGALAFGLWEVVTVNLLLHGTAFDDYAWGVSLLGMFTIFLVGLRLASDYGIRANVAMPDWANLVFGFLVGLCSATLTLGTLMIGAGHMQSHQQIAGYWGYGVSRTTGQIERIGGAIWIPFHVLTNEFYNALSVGSLHPTFEGQPLLHVNPELHRQMSMLRASYSQGQGKFSLAPEAATVREFLVDEHTNRHLITVEFGALARDFGQQMTLSRTQVRLICRVSASSQSRPQVVFADYWQQETADHVGQIRRFSWADPSHFASSIPGRDSATIVFEFPVPAGHQGAYIQIRGTRFALPTPRRETGLAGATRPPDTPQQVSAPIQGTGNDISSQVEITTDVRVVASINQLPGNIRHMDQRLIEGRGLFGSTGLRPSRTLRVLGIFEPAGTKAVQVDVSRGTPADIFGSVREQASPNAEVVLVDDRNNTYPPVGYIHRHRNGTEIVLNPRTFVRTSDQLPLLPTAGTDRLWLVFYVTDNATVTALRYGGITVGTCQVPVTADR
jgi:hypothetical protein